MLKIFYACDFSLNKPVGRNRATRQKLEALSRKPTINLTVFSIKENFPLFFAFLVNEIQLFWCVWTKKPDVLITRGASGFLVFCTKPFLKTKLVKEIHAAGIEELRLLPFKGLKKWITYLNINLSLAMDRRVDLRIFNHPNLLEWYSKTYKMRGANCYVYNGFDPTAKSNLECLEARKKFNLESDMKYLVFTGAASKWHGVEYLVSLQQCFNKHADNVLIICGGGSMEGYDPQNLCLNFSPLEDADCADLIRASDACLLPVLNVRVSPGSPLKLYDYILNERPVIAQSDQLGYSDEVQKYKVGITVNFPETEEVRLNIICFLEELENTVSYYPKCVVSWDDRINEWLENIEKLID